MQRRWVCLLSSLQRDCAWESLCGKCLYLPHMGCLRHHTQQRRLFWWRGVLGGEAERSATKGQCKVFSSSHGNRGKTDKGLPRKAMLWLQHKTLSFNLKWPSFSVSLIVQRWRRQKRKDSEMIYPKLAPVARNQSLMWVSEGDRCSTEGMRFCCNFCTSFQTG